MEIDNREDLQRAILEKEIVAVKQSSTIIDFVLNEREQNKEVKKNKYEVKDYISAGKSNGIAGINLKKLLEEGSNKADLEWISLIKQSEKEDEAR